MNTYRYTRTDIQIHIYLSADLLKLQIYYNLRMMPFPMLRELRPRPARTIGRRTHQGATVGRETHARCERSAIWALPDIVLL